MQKQVEVLDHGYISIVESWGSDQSIIEAARMSTNKGFLGWGGEPCTECESAGRLDNTDRLFVSFDTMEEARQCSCKGKGVTTGDEKLLAYLYNNKHSTPFEMAGLIIEVQAPIFVFREWHRHRTQSYNEMSARYTPLPDLNYIPTVERLLVNSKKNKQAGVVAGADELTEEGAELFRSRLIKMYEDQEHFYQMSLQMGVPKELARIDLPVGRYSRMRASANLRNWLSFLTLRADSKAQWEIQEYANPVATFIRQLFPRTYELFADGAR